VNSAVQGSGADKLKAAMVALQGRLGGGAALPRGTCRLVHSVRDLQAASDMAVSVS
jgi:DNA polymerase I-like protein with 3'-5' exonuclease and polymerase domains